MVLRLIGEVSGGSYQVIDPVVGLARAGGDWEYGGSIKITLQPGLEL